MNNLGSKTRAPRVSVIVPAYNVTGYLERALDSALAQTMLDLEVIVVDDASEDATFEVARRIAARDPRVRVLQNERNSGPSASRNRAIGTARGEWIALLDGDDAWLPERLEQMMAYADNADVISDDVYIVRRSLMKPNEYEFWSLLREHGLTFTEPRQISLLDFVQHDLGPLKPIIRRSFVERHQLTYDPAVCHGEDFVFYFEVLALEARWLQLPHGYYLWTSGRAGSLSFDRRALWQTVIENIRPLFNHPAAARDATLAAALERLVQKAHNSLVVRTFQNLMYQIHPIKLTHLFLRKPSVFLLIMKAVVNRFRLRYLARRYGFTKPPGPDHRAHPKR